MLTGTGALTLTLRLHYIGGGQKIKKGLSETSESPVFAMVGDIGFEPTTSTV